MIEIRELFKGLFGNKFNDKLRHVRIYYMSDNVICCSLINTCVQKYRLLNGKKIIFMLPNNRKLRGNGYPIFCISLVRIVVFKIRLRFRKSF